MSKITLYDLDVYGPGITVSPMTTRTRICLNIKGIPFESKFLSFFEIHEQIPVLTQDTSKRPLVPVIQDAVHDNRVVADSGAIAQYLDEAFPETVPLVDAKTKGLLDFLDRSVFMGLLWPMMRLIIIKLHDSLRTKELQDWYRKDRERMFNCTLEEFARDDASNIAELKAPLEIVHHVLKTNRYLTGEKVGYADVILAGAFVFLKTSRPDIFDAAVLDVVPDSDLIRKWWARIEPYTGAEPPKENTIDTFDN
ncbi:hypothetical protein BC940DRAFT_313809 [Gongronella butleri]|nr:hypothetical protein BC940DRAFT_313809 [Gongronella butleri]